MNNSTKVLALLLLASPVLGDAPKKPLTLERLTAEPPLTGRPISGLSWRDARRFTYLVSDGFGPDAKRELWQYEVATGKRTKLAEAIPLPPDAAAAQEKKKDEKDEAKPKTLSLGSPTWN